MISEETRRVIQIIDNEIFAKHILFKQAPRTYRTKKADLEFVREKFMKAKGITEEDIKEYDERKEIEY